MREEVKNWWKQARHDFEVAEYNLKGNMLDSAAFYAQQSVEKGLKALYLEKKNELWRTHDLVKLANLVNAPVKIVKFCNDLSPIYFEDRYPDFLDVIPAEKFSEEDVNEFIKKAEKTIKWIKTKLS